MPFDSHAGHTTVTVGSERAFGGVFTLVFLLVGLWPLTGGGDVRGWALAVAGAFLAATLIRPSLLAPFNRLWFRFGMLLHRIVSPLVMGLLFFVTVTPTALVFRLLGKDLLKLRPDSTATTYWVQRDADRTGTMTNQF